MATPRKKKNAARPRKPAAPAPRRAPTGKDVQKYLGTDEGKKYLQSDEGKAYFATDEGKKVLEDYNRSLAKDKPGCFGWNWGDMFSGMTFSLYKSKNKE